MILKNSGSHLLNIGDICYSFMDFMEVIREKVNRSMCYFSFLCSEETELKLWKFFPFASQSIVITDNFEVWELNYLTPNKQSWSE